MASRGVEPGAMRLATARICCSIRASSACPHSYVSSRLTSAPRKWREERAYRSRPTASSIGASARSSVSQERCEPVVGSRRIRCTAIDVLADRARQLAVGGCRPRREVAKKPFGAALSRLWAIPASTCRRGTTSPARRCGLQRGDVTVDRVGQAAQAAGNNRPILGGGCRHQIEDQAQDLHRTLDVVQPGLSAPVARISSSVRNCSDAAARG